MDNEADRQPLSIIDIQNRLADLPGWEYKDNKIFKTFEFPSFNDALALINQLAPICNELDHHPDINWSYRTVTFSLTRYSIGGKVTERDFRIAEAIEDLFGK